MTETAAPPSAPPAVGWASGPLGAVQAADREIGRQTALRARAVAEFAATRPASADRPAGTPGAMSAERRAARPVVLADVSEWATEELAMASSLTSTAAQNQLERSLTLVHRLPRTLAALESGLVHDGHLWSLLERVAVVADEERRAELERDVLAWVAARTARSQVTTPAQLADRIRRMGLGRDPKREADELLAALRARGVWVRPDRRAGMAVFESLLTMPQARVLVDALGRYADALDAEDDGRTRGERMVDVLMDRVLRPEESDLPPVQAQLTLVAGIRTLLGGGAPGEVDGEPVPAELVRALARALGLLPDAVPAPQDPEAPGSEGPEQVRDRLPAGCDPDGPPDESWPDWLRADFDRWEAELEARALAGVWGGADDPPPEVQQCWWEREARWDAQPADDHDTGDRGTSDRDRDGGTAAPPTTPATGNDPDGTATGTPTRAPSPGTASTTPAGPGPGKGAAARAAVEQAGLALLSLDQALRRASAATGAAWLEDRDAVSAVQATSGHRVDSAGSDLDALRTASTQRRAQLAALLDRTAGGTLADRPRIAVVDELTGVLVALTDARELRRLGHCGAPACTRTPGRCDHDLTGRPGLGPPPATDGYRPGAALDRFVRRRDAHCRFPGCRRRVPAGGELDHHTPWPGGATGADNLVGYCTGHHRAKHQAPGWRHSLGEDGTLTVTTPTGLVATTAPPPF